ncbi:MAG: extracellular solute-binding protein, partial [Clostridiales bacterium]|nr:extracellular solute-binding protein [Clostridiales bacterium]
TALLEIENAGRDMLVSVSNFYVDASGYSYLLLDRGTKLQVFDAKGKLCMERVLLEDNAVSCNAFHMPDGSLVFYVPDQDEQRIAMLWFEMPGGKQKQLAELDYRDNAQVMTITEAGDLYLLQTSALLKWNVVSGEKKVLFNCIQSDLEFQAINSMEVTPEGKVLLYQSTENSMAVLVLGDEEIKTDEGIVLAGMAYTDNYVKAQTAAFSRKYPDTSIVYETGSSDAEAYRNQVMAQLVAGKGPDLLWVDGADMQILKEKGALMDLRTLIPEETVQQIFPGIIEAGTIDGTLTGLFFDAYACTMLVNNEVWPKESISSLEILELAKQRDSLQGLICSDMTFSKNVIFSIAALSNPAKSPFIDWEAGESRFERPEFVELLELINKYGDNPNGNMKNRVKEGEFLAYRVTIEARNLPEYSELMAEYGDNCHLMGFPDDDAHQGFWPHSRFLVVNAKTENGEAIAKLFEYLLSREAQQKVTMGSVRRDVIEQSVVLGVSDGKYKFRSGDNSYYALETKEDGSTYLEEYLEFLDNCAPMPRGYEEIEEIVTSVVEEYFNGQHTAEKAADLIDNRVQLYLDEQK